jgi:S-adenosyl methyltransferase
MTDGLDAMRAALRTDRPTPARMYDYYLGGKDNFAVDRAAVDAMSPQMTELLKNAAWENRRFVWRVVDYLARECGVTQFIDVGSGLPTVRSTHEVAQEINPDARVVYVDNDPIVLSHGQALLAKNGNTAVVSADVRDPESILNATEIRQLIDFSKPVAVLIVALFHFVTEPGHPRHVPGNASPGDIVAAFREHVAPGSYLALTHITSDDPEEVVLIEDLYKSATSPVIFRSREEVTELFQGWCPLPPGIVRPWAWPAEDPASPRTALLWGGIGIKDTSERSA